MKVTHTSPEQLSELAENIYEGLGGFYQAAKGIALQAHKRAYDGYNQNLERDKIAGMQAMGIDVRDIDSQIPHSAAVQKGEDLDSSVKISGDHTHFHMTPMAETSEAAQPVKPQVAKPSLPTWASVLLGAGLASGIGGAGMGLGYMLNKPTTTTTIGADDVERTYIGLSVED